MKKSPAEIKKDVEASIASYQRDLDLIRTILKVLQPMDGKKITKAFATAISKAVPRYSVSYNRGYSSYEITIFGDDISYNKRFSLGLGYVKEEVFDFAKFVSVFAQRYLLNEGRISELENALRGMEPKLEAYEKAKAAAEAARADLGPIAYYLGE